MRYIRGGAACSVLLLVLALGPSYGDEKKAAPERNPVLEKFAENVTFHAGYDAGAPDADMASGKAKPVSVEGKAAFADGLIGKALSNGTVVYDGPKNVNLQSPGTLLFWTSIARAGADPKKEGYLFPVRIFAADKDKRGALYMVGKMDAVNQCPLYLHVEVNGKKAAQIVEGSTLEWKPGQWHLIAFSWRRGAVELSVDGAPPRMATTADLPDEVSRLLISTWSDPDGKYSCLLDEVMILNRLLDEEEIGWVWREMRERREKQ